MTLETNPSVRLTIAEGIARISLERPHRFNAITVPMMQRLGAALEEAGCREDVGCVVLSATGKGFCTGQDLKVLAQHYQHHSRASLGDVIERHYNAVIARMRQIDVPIIAAVQGVAAGAGWSIALACDLRVAAESARFVPAFAQLGLIPDLGGTQSLVEAAGYARAMEYALLDDGLSARDALRIGLVNRVVADDELGDQVTRWATRIASLPRRGVMLTKRALRSAAERSLTEQLRVEAWYQSMAASQPEHDARVQAFVTRRDRQ